MIIESVYSAVKPAGSTPPQDEKVLPDARERARADLPRLALPEDLHGFHVRGGRSAAQRGGFAQHRARTGVLSRRAGGQLAGTFLLLLENLI